MSDYLLGCDCEAGTTVDTSGKNTTSNNNWGKPVVVNDPTWGTPVTVSGHGGGGGGHGGGGHGGGHGGRFGGGPVFWGGGWYDGPDYYDQTDVVVLPYCLAYDADDNCIKYVSTDVLGFEVLGMFDIGEHQKELDSLKTVPVSVAQALVRGGQQTIAAAISGAKQPWYKSDLPGETSRSNVQAHLQWHADKLSKLSSTPNAIYDSADDLKKFVMSAFVEGNAVEEGAAYLGPMWSQMWSDVGRAIAALPKEVAQQVNQVTGDLVKNLTGLPIWAWCAIGSAVLGVAGFFVYKLANSKAGAAVASTAARRYMP